MADVHVIKTAGASTWRGGEGDTHMRNILKANHVGSSDKESKVTLMFQAYILG